MKRCIECGRSSDNREYACPFCQHQPTKLNGHWAFAPGLAENSDGFEVEFFPTLVELEAGHYWFRSRNCLLIWALGHYFPNAKNLLEIGCGTGFVLAGIQKAFPELHLCGSEIFSAGLTFAEERLPGVELFQMDARQIPFREEFDVIGAFDVLEHIKEDDDVLSQMYQSTQKEGGIILTVPHHPFLWSQVDSLARHVRRYKTRELREKIVRAGFEIERITSFVSLLLPVLAISRFVKRDNLNNADELRIGSLTNRALEKILGAERRMIQMGLSFPMGGSLLVVARRRA